MIFDPKPTSYGKRSCSGRLPLSPTYSLSAGAVRTPRRDRSRPRSRPSRCQVRDRSKPSFRLAHSASHAPNRSRRSDTSPVCATPRFLRTADQAASTPSDLSHTKKALSPWTCSSMSWTKWIRKPFSDKMESQVLEAHPERPRGEPAQGKLGGLGMPLAGPSTCHGCLDRGIVDVRKQKPRTAGGDLVDQLPRLDEMIEKPCAEDRVIPLRGIRLPGFDIRMAELAFPAAENPLDELGAGEIVPPSFQARHPFLGGTCCELQAVRSLVRSEIHDLPHRDFELLGPLEKEAPSSGYPSGLLRRKPARRSGMETTRVQVLRLPATTLRPVDSFPLPDSLHPLRRAAERRDYHRCGPQVPEAKPPLGKLSVERQFLLRVVVKPIIRRIARKEMVRNRSRLCTRPCRARHKKQEGGPKPPFPESAGPFR